MMDRSQPSNEHSPLPWIVEPDEREGYEWNFHIVERDRPHMRVCFMTSGPEAEKNAYLIVDSINAITALKARIEELEGALRSVSTQCGNVIFNCGQRPADNERHLSSWKGVKEFADAAIQPKAGS